MASPSLDTQLMSEMSAYVEELTTSGSNKLNEETMKKFKKICRRSDEYVKHAFHLIFTQLEKDHSEIRRSAFLMMDELFNRSHQFRELVLADFQTILELVLEINYDLPLPPPKPAAQDLKNRAVETVQKWYDKFAEGYRKLALGYNFLKKCRKIDFTAIQQRNIAERRRIEEEERRKQLFLQQKVEKALTEMTDIQVDIDQCLLQFDNCVRLLLPHPDDFHIDTDPTVTEPDVSLRNQEEKYNVSMSKDFNGANNTEECIETPQTESLERHNKRFSATDTGSIIPDEVQNDKVETSGLGIYHESPEVADNENCESDNDSNDAEFDSVTDQPDLDLIQQHGFGSRKFQLNIEMNPGQIQESEDNTDILNILRDSYRLITVEFLPKVLKWMEIFTKAGTQNEKLKSAIKVKESLVVAKQKYEDLRIQHSIKPYRDHHKPHSAEQDGDDDFEDVPEKEGYEEDIPEELKEKDKPSTSYHPREWIPKPKPIKDDVHDPTTVAANLFKLQKKFEKMKEKPSSTDVPSTSKQKETNKKRTEELKKAPVVPYDMDLYNWENPGAEPPAVVRFDSLHRFWTPRENEEFVAPETLEAFKSRKIEFTGDFKPVKWTCRAPLPNGKLCTRMDRVKCPFHGKIIARDEMGNPANPTEKKQQGSSQEEEGSVPPWQDPELQQDIQAATGIDLGATKSKGKGKGKGKKSKKKYPNLTDIRKVGNTSRRRLESKVLSRTAMKRVAAKMDSLDARIHRDKFANNFNYAIKPK